MKYLVTIFLLIICIGCKPKPQTQFRRDYTVLQPKIARCESYYISRKIPDALNCLNEIAPLANKTILEANEGDSEYQQNIEANLMSMRINTLGTDIMIWEMNQ